ncbi:putative gustatory receptor 98a [Drosophila kikkawai]|uniref:Gustatory receptor n=1 Tax=Drosophila kikkawai TaxID=30033 RepID=A0A6P4JHD4_DROKI|nr:putative gustatory receptor 98a [Drosophila kikkawai]
MGPVSGELHAVSLLGMNRVMKCMVMLPVSKHLIAKVFCNAVLFTTVGFSTSWRLSFEYDLAYDFRNDPFSRIIDLMNFIALITSHVIIVMELVWLKSGDDINSQLEEIRREMNVLLGVQVNLQRVRAYCNAVYASLFIRCLAFGLVTIYANRSLTYYAFYSEIVLLVRFSQFTLFSAVIMVLYQELSPAGESVLAELECSLFELSSVRRSSLEKLAKLQRVHGLLWRAIRCLEHNFQICLITMLLKFFVDTSALPYWIYLSKVQHTGVAVQSYCGIDECVKILEVVVPCWICTRCDVMQRRFRSMFYTLTKDRRNSQLNAALNRLCLQLGQERCQFSAGGLVEISTEMLGKFLFGMISYIVICIQFSLNLTASNSSKVASIPTTNAPL